MYIWRGKNRRDRRQYKLSGPFVWGAAKGSHSTELEDDILRQEGEEAHVNYFHDSIRVTIFKYLNTVEGKIEVDYVIKELEEDAKKLAIAEALAAAKAAGGGGQVDLTKVVVVPAEMKKKKNIYEIFRKYDADGSDSIDKGEIRILLDELNVPMTKEELDELFEELDEDGGGEIDFEEFYNWFAREADAQRDKNSSWFDRFKGKKEGGGVYGGFKRLVMEVEARNLVMDHAVWKAEIDARHEYRIAHPVKFKCDLCYESFATPKALKLHHNDVELHKAREQKDTEDRVRFASVERVHNGLSGRKLFANRLLFSTDLAPMEDRIKAATSTPFRPMLSDPEGRRNKQLLAGATVQGSDPKMGVRPAPRRFANLKERAPGRRHDQPMFQDVLSSLLHCRDEAIDIVSAPSTSMHAEVLFVWKGYAKHSIQLVGEFNGWKPEELEQNPALGKCSILKPLGPGKYRYRYRIDGEDTIDPTASVIDDPKSGKPFNIILVINPMLDVGGVHGTKGPVVDRSNRPKRLEAVSSSSGLDNNKSDNHSINSNYEQRRMSADNLSVASLGTAVTEASQMSWKKEGLKQLAALPSNWVIAGASAIENNRDLHGLTQINLRNLCLYDDGAWAFAAFLQRNSKIKSIDFSFNSISDEGMQALCSTLPKLLALETLKFNGNGFGIDGIRYLTNMLASSACIKRLELSGNCLGDDCTELIAEKLLLRHPTLEQLYLDSVLMDIDGLNCIAEALLSNRILTTLSLQKNLFNVDSIRRFCEALQANGTLTELKLNNNLIGGAGVKIIGEMLLLNDTIATLDLSGVDMMRGKSSQGLGAIGFALRSNRGLKHLFLCNNNIGDDAVIDLAYALTYNNALLTVDLANNPLHPQWFQPNTFIFTRILHKMPTIRTSLDRIKELLSDSFYEKKYSVKPKVR